MKISPLTISTVDSRHSEPSIQRIDIDLFTGEWAIQDPTSQINVGNFRS